MLKLLYCICIAPLFNFVQMRYSLDRSNKKSMSYLLSWKGSTIQPKIMTKDERELLNFHVANTKIECIWSDLNGLFVTNLYVIDYVTVFTTEKYKKTNS